MSPQTAKDAYALANGVGNTPVKWWSSSDGRIELAIALEDARCGSHQGQCDDDIAVLRAVPYIAEQLAQITAEAAREDLRGYGAWDDSELADHELNLNRVLWLACGDIVEAAP